MSDTTEAEAPRNREADLEVLTDGDVLAELADIEIPAAAPLDDLDGVAEIALSIEVVTDGDAADADAATTEDGDR